MLISLFWIAIIFIPIIPNPKESPQKGLEKEITALNKNNTTTSGGSYHVSPRYSPSPARQKAKCRHRQSLTACHPPASGSSRLPQHPTGRDVLLSEHRIAHRRRNRARPQQIPTASSPRHNHTNGPPAFGRPDDSGRNHRGNQAQQKPYPKQAYDPFTP